MARAEVITNDDDFIRREGGVESLTVTVTLAEYRRLITESVTAKQKIEGLTAEVERLSAGKTTQPQAAGEDAAEEEAEMKEIFKDYSGRYCRVFYCDKAGERICCRDCPMLGSCPARRGPCINDPEHCDCVECKEENKT